MPAAMAANEPKFRLRLSNWRAQRQPRQTLAQNLQAAVRTAIHHEHHFPLARHAGIQLDQFAQQAVEIFLVPVDRNHQRVHFTSSRNSE